MFAPHNLLSDPPFSRLDLVSCRNLLIYLQRDVQQDVIELFHYALKPGGYLVVGTAETLESSELFHVENKHCCFYSKRNIPGPEPRLPVFPVIRTRTAGAAPGAGGAAEPITPGLLHHRIVEEFAPPSMLVSPDDNVVHFSEHAGRYLDIPGGEPTSFAAKLIRPELRAELNAALAMARERREPMATRPVDVKLGGQTAPVVLDVRPALGPHQQGFALVIFDERKTPPPTAAAPPEAGHPPPRDASQEEAFEAELLHTRQRHQSIVEEYETTQEELRASNEELHSANEELRSTLEELETSKEELQSINEELQTVNQENRHKVEELDQLSGDLQNLMAATDIATLFLDRDLRILRYTPRARDLFNVRPTDRGRPLSDLTHQLGDEELQSEAQSVLDRLSSVERVVSDTQRRSFLMRMLPYRDSKDRIEGVVLTFIDITERIEAEAALRLSEERFRALVEASSQMVWTTDAEGRAVEDSPWRLYTGQTYEQWKNWGWLDAIHPDDQPKARRHWRQAIEDRAPLTTECRVRHAASGEYRWTSVRAVPLADGDGTVRGWVGMNIDINAQMQGELALKEADRRKNEFLATLAHELRNPLAPIRTGLEVMKSSLDDPAKLEEIRAMIERQANQLIVLVDDLLDVARINRGAFQLRMRPESLDEIVRSAVEASRPFIEKAGHELTIATARQPIVVNADPNRLAQVIANLLNNAAKYTPEGGHVWLETQSDAGDAVLTVRDTGRGIAAENLDDIFAMFSQVEDHQQSPGLGVGLALAKQLVELHGGRIEATSDGPGKGSAFRVRLPIATGAEVDETPTDVKHSAGPTQTLRVLVVDDNVDAANMLSRLVKALGHQVRTANDGAEAIDAASTFRPDVVLMDLGMPRMNGCEAAKHIRLQTWGKDMTLVALTGWGQDEDRQRTKDAGFDRHLVKPVAVDSLREESSRRSDQMD